jgi:Flp pilus assembly protein TadB
MINRISDEGEDMADVRRTASTSGAARRQRTFFAGETEARPGIMTSEFWLAVLSAATVVIASYISGALPIRLGWALFTGIVAAYLLSRGIAKAGSSEGPFVLGDRGQSESRSRG